MKSNTNVTQSTSEKVNTTSKVRRSPPSRTFKIGNQAPSGSNGDPDGKNEQLNFTTDMKRLGLMADIQNNMNEQTVNKKKLIIKKRHISPPPALNGSTSIV